MEAVRTARTGRPLLQPPTVVAAIIKQTLSQVDEDNRARLAAAIGQPPAGLRKWVDTCNLAEDPAKASKKAAAQKAWPKRATVVKSGVTP
eukprot:5578258-Prymnesium_polylepis.1